MRAWPVARSIFDAPLCERSERGDNKLDKRRGEEEERRRGGEEERRRGVVGLQPTVIASRAPHLLLEQSVRFKESWTCIARQERRRGGEEERRRGGEEERRRGGEALEERRRGGEEERRRGGEEERRRGGEEERRRGGEEERSCRFTTYRHRFARAAPAPRAKRKIQRIVDVHRPSREEERRRGGEEERRRRGGEEERRRGPRGEEERRRGGEEERRRGGEEERRRGGGEERRRGGEEETKGQKRGLAGLRGSFLRFPLSTIPSLPGDPRQRGQLQEEKKKVGEEERG